MIRYPQDTGFNQDLYWDRSDYHVLNCGGGGLNLRIWISGDLLFKNIIK